MVEEHKEEHKDDFKPIMYGVIVLFLVVVVGWVSFLVLNACGPHLECPRVKNLNLTVRTPVPTLVPGTLPAPEMGGKPGASDVCAVKALDLIGAWASAGSPESDAFLFQDVNGRPCSGTFGVDIQPLFSETNVWFPASLACMDCHNTTFKEGTGGLDLTSYAGILAGSGRATADVTKGRDILGAGNWPSSILVEVLSRTENIPTGHPPLAYSAPNLIVYAGAHVVAVIAPTTIAP